MTNVTSTGTFFYDADGEPLDQGKVYVGVYGANPISSPVTVYSDAENTQIIPQPIETLDGFAVYNGNRIQTYVDTTETQGYSISVVNKLGVTVFSDKKIPSTVVGSTALMVEDLVGYVNVTECATKAELSLLDVQDFSTAIFSGHIFYWDSSDLSDDVAADTLKAIYVPPASDATGASGAWVRDFSSNDGALFEWFGGIADSTDVGTGTDNWSTLKTAHATCVSLGIPLLLGSGRYRINPTEALNMPEEGGIIRGASNVLTRINVDEGKTFEIGDDGSGTADKFHGEITGIHIVGNSDCVVRFGAGDYSTSVLNSYTIDLKVNNDKSDIEAIGLEVNHVLQSDIKAVSNCAQSGNPDYHATGFGIAARLTQAQFCDFDLACGNANIGLKMTGGYVQGNTFSSMFDVEEVKIGIEIDESNVVGNLFLGGTIVAVETVNATDGRNNRAIGSIVGTGYEGHTLFASGGERFGFENCNMPGFSSSDFAIPTSGTIVRNLTGRKLCLRAEGSFSGFVVSKADGNSYSLGGLGAGYPITVIVAPYDGVTPTYTGSPSWSPYPQE